MPQSCKGWFANVITAVLEWGYMLWGFKCCTDNAYSLGVHHTVDVCDNLISFLLGTFSVSPSWTTMEVSCYIYFVICQCDWRVLMEDTQGNSEVVALVSLLSPMCGLVYWFCWCFIYLNMIRVMGRWCWVCIYGVHQNCNETNSCASFGTSYFSSDTARLSYRHS